MITDRDPAQEFPLVFRQKKVLLRLSQFFGIFDPTSNTNLLYSNTRMTQDYPSVCSLNNKKLSSQFSNRSREI